MSFLTKLLEGVLFKLIARFFNYLGNLIAGYIAEQKTKKIYDEQVEAIMSTADQIKKLLKEGKPVPQELKDKLREESNRLIDGTFDSAVK